MDQGRKGKKNEDSMRPSTARSARPARVKNKQPAEVQITAEQLLREAKEKTEADPTPPKQNITDLEELEEFRLRKRKTFEDNIRKNKSLIGAWVKYAKFEEEQKDFRRARSIFERALDIDYRNASLWLKYVEMEMRNKFVNHARNIWDRAVALLPLVSQLWFKYAHMEEMLGNISGARQIFERWMEWHPDANAWSSYVKFELRYGETERARQIFEKLVVAHPIVHSWLSYAKFEERLREIEKARSVYVRATEQLGEKANDEKLYVAFAKFEERAREVERARAVYKYALNHIPKHFAHDLFKTYTAFEKQYGDRGGIEDVIISKKRFEYEEELKLNPTGYDVWFDYIRLEESAAEVEKIREVYERAIANVPPVEEKRYWRRYIYLWINYALFEELEAKNVARTREIYKACLSVIPHKSFSFAKLWVMFAHFEVRQKDVQAARVIFGNAIGKAPKDSIFNAYIQLELKLGNIDRCRALYEKYLEFNSANCQAWTKFVELEKSLGEVERARAIFELAVNQPVLDMPEIVWKAYIDFEIEQKEYEKTRALYERLLARTKHVKAWISFAVFESSISEVDNARGVFERGYKHLKQALSNAATSASYGPEATVSAEETQIKEQRVLLLESWREFEQKLGAPETLRSVIAKQPKRVRRKRPIQTVDGANAGWEEYFDYIFPDDEKGKPNLKILEMARKWKKQKVATTAEASD